MGDDLNKNLNSASGGLINQPSKSPLEKKVEASPPPAPDPVTPPPPVAPPIPQQDSTLSPNAQPTEEPVKAPDTDDFIQSILSNSTPPSTQSSPEPQPSVEQQPVPPQPNKAEEPPTVELKNEMPEQTQGMNQPSAPSFNMPPEPNGGKPVANDVVAAMQSKGPAKSSSLKVIIVPAIVLIVGLGAYLAYSKMSSTTPVSTTDITTPVADLSEPFTPSALDANTEPAATEAVALTGDAKRKADLFTIQGYLKDYQAQEGTYPVATTLTILKTGNILETELAKLSYQLPIDPDTTKSYAYKSDGQTFTLTAILEDNTDPEGIMEGGLYIFKVTPDTIKPASSTASSLDTSSTVDTAAEATIPPASSAASSTTASGLPYEGNLDTSDSFTDSTQGQY